MLIIHDARLPLPIIQTLHTYGTCIAFISKDITHQPLAGHPDLFFCPIDKQLIAAPNTPPEYLQKLDELNLPFMFGKTKVVFQKQQNTAYNVVVSEHYIIHNGTCTDTVIKEYKGEREFLHVKQAFTRCSLLPLQNDNFLTSDQGIANIIESHSLPYCYVHPDEIVLPGYKNGFVGGCMGVYKNKVFICGHLDFHPEGKKINIFLANLGYEVIELYRGPLFDGGSLVLLDG